MPDPALVLVASLVALLFVGIIIAARAGSAKRVSAASVPTPVSTEARASASSRSLEQLLSTPVDTPDPSYPTAEPMEGELDVPTVTPSPAGWQAWPVVPKMTDGALKIYQQGQQMGNNPHAFSKIGACESAATWFLEDFDKESGYYSLGEYSNLQAVIEYFKGSFARTSLAARDGARVSTLLSPLWSDPSVCETNETPLDCELRVYKPSFAIVSIGTNDVEGQDKFEGELRQVIDLIIKHGVVPILSTKADNVEGDNSNNAAIAKLAAEYDLPMWNFWKAVQEIPGGGLDYDGAHLTWGDNYFDQRGALKTGWAVRNLTALQVLDAMMKGVQGK